MSWPLPAPLTIAQGEWRLDGQHLAAPPGVGVNRHGVMRNLPRLLSLLRAHPDFAADVTGRTSIRVSEPQGAVDLLMALALSEAPDGMVIAQSRHPGRVTDLARARSMPAAAGILAALRGMA
jgi:hypothetical protein